MRRIVVFEWTTADGDFAAPDGGLDWVVPDQQLAQAVVNAIPGSTRRCSAGGPTSCSERVDAMKREAGQQGLALFERRGGGTWLADDQASGDLVGFCGFWLSPTCPGAAAQVRAARDKLGFERVGVGQGVFGTLLLLRLPPGR
jgi:hypothetical protein